jgi:hypothetical protein
VCRQRSVTVSPDAGAKQWQALEYGAEDWQKAMTNATARALPVLHPPDTPQGTSGSGQQAVTP